MIPQDLQRLALYLPFIAFSLGVLGCAALPTGRPDHVTVPLHIEANRPYIDVTFRRPDGAMRSARFLVDTGGGGFIFAEPVARDLGLKWDKATREEGAEFGHPSVAPTAFVGAMPLELDTNRVLVEIGVDRISVPGARAEGLFPGHLLARYHVVFDYPKAKFTLALPGTLKPKGNASPMPVSKRSRFPRTELEVDGARYGFLLDTGASFTMVSDALLNRGAASIPTGRDMPVPWAKPPHWVVRHSKPCPYPAGDGAKMCWANLA